VGIQIYDPTATVEDNKVANSYIAIEFSCNTATVSGNTITDAATALDSVPSSLATSNIYYGVATIRTEGCTSSDAAAKRAAMEARLKKLAGIP
jgi:hypothetical protein